MNKISIDFSKNKGKIKPMHAVNNGPKISAVDQKSDNKYFYKEAHIPYARTHDAALCSNYGGEHTVDVHAIFPDFDADVDSPDSYDFVNTDIYLKNTESAGTKVYYRLGAAIEHRPKKYAILVPRDFSKWARICEHIIRHYTEGWADGFFMDIEYWEIWNEPDLDPAGAANPRNWAGTPEEFYELYAVAATHLKKCFPRLKIGGPAVSNIYNEDWMRGFFSYIKEHNAPLDFFSWHLYASETEPYKQYAEKVNSYLDEYGYGNAESILNEWNYVKGWTDEFVYSLKIENSMKGAAFVAASMLKCQDLPIDMLMYYDARVGTAMNGLFNVISQRPQKPYYAIKFFSELYALKNQAELEISGEDIYAVAAKDSEAAICIAYYTDEDGRKRKSVELEIKAVSGKALDVFLLDDAHDAECVSHEFADTDKTSLFLDIEPNTVIFIRSREI